MSEISEKHLEFVKDRAKKVNLNAEEKLKQIDEIAEIIFIARKNLTKNQDKD